MKCAYLLLAAILFGGLIWGEQSQLPRNQKAQVLDVKLHPQEKTNWCWAGCGQMVMGFWRVEVLQCTQATKRFGLCDLNQTGWPQFDKFGFRYKTTKRAPLSWRELTSEIDNKRPFCFSKNWIGGGGHMLVVKGYSIIGKDHFVHLIDPRPVGIGDDTIVIPFEEYVDGADGNPAYTHGDDY